MSMTDDLYAMLVRDDWASMVRLCRAWFREHCPRYTAEQIETELGWVGRLLLCRQEYADRCRLPDTDGFGRPNPRKLTPADGEALLRAEMDRKFPEALATYRRHVARVDSPEPAEKRVEQVVRNIAARQAAA